MAEFGGGQEARLESDVDALLGNGTADGTDTEAGRLRSLRIDELLTDDLGGCG